LTKFCERCRAELDGTAERLPPPWFDHDRRMVLEVQLTPTEWRVLEVLWRRRGRPVSNDSLMALLYDSKPRDPPDDKLIKVYICRLRAALDPTPYSIKTDWGTGYELLLRKYTAEIELGEIEDGVPPPARELPPATGDKYGFQKLKKGQSRKIGNTKISAVRSACQYAARRGWGRFNVAPDSNGELRIWRLE
jgi:hypothetical protein